MTDHEIQLLAIGAALGMYLMLFVQIGFGILDDRRDRKATRAAEAMLEAARAMADLPSRYARKAAATQSSATLADLRESTAVARKRADA